MYFDEAEFQKLTLYSHLIALINQRQIRQGMTTSKRVNWQATAQIERDAVRWTTQLVIVHRRLM